MRSTLSNAWGTSKRRAVSDAVSILVVHTAATSYKSDSLLSAGRWARMANLSRPSGLLLILAPTTATLRRFAIRYVLQETLLSTSVIPHLGSEPKGQCYGDDSRHAAGNHRKGGAP